MRANRSHCLAFPVCRLSSNYEKRFYLYSWNLEMYFIRWLKFKLKMSKDFSNLLPFHDDCIFSNGSCSCSLFSIGSAVCTKRYIFQIYNIWVYWHFIAIEIIYLWRCLDVGLRVITRSWSHLHWHRPLPILSSVIKNLWYVKFKSKTAVFVRSYFIPLNF